MIIGASHSFFLEIKKFKISLKMFILYPFIDLNYTTNDNTHIINFYSIKNIQILNFYYININLRMNIVAKNHPPKVTSEFFPDASFKTI